MKNLNTVYKKCLLSALGMIKNCPNNTRHASGYFGRHAHPGGLLFLFYCFIYFAQQYKYMVHAASNSTSHAFRKICAPWEVVFFPGARDAIL